MKSSSKSSDENRTSFIDGRGVDPEVRPTRLIDDTPAEDDLLAFHEDIGPHERVAKAIAEVICSPGESGGKMIGLEGGWGAGKTTVINLLRKQLAANDNITVYSFDAWAHEGDPLRRTYLESLIQHFQSIGWIDKTKWDKVLEKLANRRRVTSTRTVPKITALGKRFGISALLVPVGIPFLITSLQQGIQISWMFGIGLSLTLAPFIVLGGNCISVGWKRWRKKLEDNRTRDAKVQAELRSNGWRVVVIWECSVRRPGIDRQRALGRACSRAGQFLRSKRKTLEISGPISGLISERQECS